MGNCLQCFQTSMTTATETTTASTEPTAGNPVLGANSTDLSYTADNNVDHTTVYQTRQQATTTCNSHNTEGRYGGVGIGLGLGPWLGERALQFSTSNNHSRRNFMYDQHSAHEKNELLASKSPLKFENNCDTKRSSFKKSLVKLAENSANMGDILSTESLEVSDNALNMLFESYKDPDVDMILTEGIERLCLDLNYQPDEFAILVLAWCLDASQMCQFTKTEFIEGLHKICADSIKAIRIRLEQTIEMLKVDTEMFKQLYRFTFRFGLDPDQRILSLEIAISLWKLVFTVHTPHILSNWLHFLEQNPSIRGIPKDTWNMFLNFTEQCDINNYDDTEAWPSLFDDFVDYEKMRLAGNVQHELEAQNSHNENKTWLVEKLDDDEDVQDDDNNNDHSANTLSTSSNSATVAVTSNTTPTRSHTEVNDIL